MKRTSGRRKRSTMQHKPNLETGLCSAIGPETVNMILWCGLLVMGVVLECASHVFFLCAGLVGHSHPKAKQQARPVRGQQVLALRHLKRQQTQIQRRGGSLKMTWILSQARARLRRHRVRYIVLNGNRIVAVPATLYTFHYAEYVSHVEFIWMSGTGWIADFGEVNSKAPAAGLGFSAWDGPTSQPATTAETQEKGWAKFTDFQPFCW